MTSLYLGAVILGLVGGALGYLAIHGTWKDLPLRKRRTETPPDSL